MKISTFQRHAREGLKNILRNSWSSFASITAIAVSLFVLGLFLLLSMNISYLANQIENQVEIRVYLEIGTSPQEIEEIKQQLIAIPHVKTITFISKEEGLIYLSEKLGESGKQLLDSFGKDENPLNDAFTIEVDEPLAVAETANSIESLNQTNAKKTIAKVSYGKGTIETLFRVTAVFRTIGFGIVVLLCVTSVLLIANTIKLTIMSRRKEISIMKLVGATNSFIRWPFFVEGAFIGLIGAGVPLIILLYGYWNLLHSGKLDLSILMLQLKPLGELSGTLILMLISIGSFMGVFGSLLSIRKYLKV
jgi:cell division transport system permease protein